MPRHQRGIAALELALVMPVLLILLALPLYFGRVFWYYAALQKGAQNAARYVSSVPLADLKNAARAGHVVDMASEIAHDHLAEINPGTDTLDVEVQCDGVRCDGKVTPSTVRVFIRVNIDDIFFPDVTQMTILLTADATASYIGN